MDNNQIRQIMLNLVTVNVKINALIKTLSPEQQSKYILALHELKAPYLTEWESLLPPQEFDLFSQSFEK